MSTPSKASQLDRRKLCVVTGTRADYGLLKPLMAELRDDPAVALQTIVTGMHLAPEFGLTYRQLEEDGFTIDARVEAQLSSDTGVGAAKSLGLGVIGMADALARLSPDLLVLLGDRYETFAAAQAALLLRLPVAHIAGGDTTEGAFDEALRHAITKIAALHFVTNEAAYRRVVQMGEDPARVYNFGSPGLDTLRLLEPTTKSALEDALTIKLRAKTLLVTYHPVTLEAESKTGYQALLEVLAGLEPEFSFVFTGANADPEGRALTQLTRAFVAQFPERTHHFTSLGKHYLQLLRVADAVVGNSSSGLYEAPSFGVPTVNIGDRQRGRAKADSVFDALPDAASIRRALLAALARGVRPTVNPYGDGHAAPKIKAVLIRTALPTLLKKRFYDLPQEVVGER